MTTQYRALLVDPGKTHDRPVQIISQRVEDVWDWAIMTLAGGTQLPGPAKVEVTNLAKVEIYTTEERLTTTFDVNMARELKKKKLEAQR